MPKRLEWNLLFLVFVFGCGTEAAHEHCGNGIIEPQYGEECDDGQETLFCDFNCTNAMCGDGYRNVTAGEECDDGNVFETDACLPSCRQAPW